MKSDNKRAICVLVSRVLPTEPLVDPPSPVDSTPEPDAEAMKQSACLKRSGLREEGL